MLCDVVVTDFALAGAAYPPLVEISDLDLFPVMDFVAILVWFLAFDTFARAFAADAASTDSVPLDLAFAISATPDPCLPGSVLPYAFGSRRSFLHHFRVKGSCH